MFFTRSRNNRSAFVHRPRPASCRPWLEVLEGRCLLSAGDLDPGFGSGGVVITSFHSGNDFATDVMMQSDSKIVAVGETPAAGGTHQFALARYTTNGALDPSFGSGGKVTTKIGQSASGYTAALYPNLGTSNDGKIVAAGNAYSGSTRYDFALARYHTNGSLDKSFGSKGTVMTAFGTGRDAIGGVVIQADGKIVAAGNATLPSSPGPNHWQFALARYNANGSLDTTYGNGGKVTHVVGTGDSVINGAVLQSDGKVVVVGWARDATQDGIGYHRFFTLARYNTNGSLDSTFGNNGIFISPFGGGSFGAYGIARQPDGKFVAVGQVENTLGTTFWGVARYQSNGSLDPTFGVGGLVTTLVPGNANRHARAVAIQADGKIVVTGDTGIGNFTSARYDAFGNLDSTFGNAGLSMTQIGGAGDGIVVQTDGKIVASGGAQDNFAVVRYADVQPLLAEALARWQAAGANVAALRGIDIRIANLGGAFLGMTDGNTIWLDDNAAGWGWFVDPTPWEDSEYTTPGDQGEQGRMDLLTVIAHELGHLLGQDHEADGLMAETLTAGTRLAISAGNDADTSRFAADALFALLAADDETPWIGNTLFGRGRKRR